MNISTRQILKVLHVLAWIIFVGVCIEAGGFLVNVFFAFVNPGIVKKLWHEADLSILFERDRAQFIVMYSLMAAVALFRAWMFYLIIKFLYENKLDIARPFNMELRRFVSVLSAQAFLIGLFSAIGTRYCQWLIREGVPMPDTESLRLGGADVWLFMSVILFVILQVLKRGIEIQSENELTV